MLAQTSEFTTVNSADYRQKKFSALQTTEDESVYMSPQESRGDTFKHRRRGDIKAVTQSQIIYNQQRSHLVTEAMRPKRSKKNLLDFGEEEVKQQSLSGGSRGTNSSSSVRRGEKALPTINRLTSTTVRKPYRELNDLQRLHTFSASQLPIWVVKFRQDGKFLATGGKDGLLRVY